MKPLKGNVFVKVLVSIVLILVICSALIINLSRQKKDVSNNNIGATTIDKDIPFQIAPSAIGDVNITPVSFSKFGVSLDSDFYIDTNIHINEKELSEKLKLSTEGTFKISKQDEPNKFLLKFDKPLEKDKIYNIQYISEEKAPLSFAFQTVSSFKVAGTTPGNDKYSVPINTGIEITFNKELKDGIENYFSITPNVNGEFTKNNLTYIFIPDKLDADTKYTITINKDISSTDNEKLENNYTFTFYTEWSNEQSVNIYGDKYETFLPNDDVIIELYASEQFINKPYEVNVYDLKDAKSYINFKDNNTVTSSPILNLKTDLFVQPNDNYRRGYIMLDKTLPVGYYYVQITTENNGEKIVLDKLIQVHPLSVYTFSKNGQLCFWINDTKTGKPANDVSIDVDGNTAKTDQNGIAMVKSKKNSNTNITLKSNSYPEFVYAMETFDKEEVNISRRYYSYIYTDRGVYRNKDTINVFGVVRQKYEKYPVPTKLTLKIADVVTTDVTLKKDGTFKAEIPVEYLEGLQYIELISNNEVITTTSISFSNYVNKTYIMSFKSDKKAYMYNETAKCVVNITTYDGVPTEGVSLSITQLNNKVIKTDKDGNAYFDISFMNNYYYNTEPYEQNISYKIVDAENEVEFGYGEVVVVPNDVLIKTNSLETGKVEVRVNKIDVNKLNQLLLDEKTSIYDIDHSEYSYEPANITAYLDIYKRVFTKNLVYETYDFVQKKKVPYYEYSTSLDMPVEPRKSEINIINGSYTISDLPIGDSNTYYFGKLTYDKTVHDVRWMNFIEPQAGGSIYDYVISMDKKNDDYYNTFSIGESKPIKLIDGNKDIVNTGSLLTIVTGNDIYDTNVTSPTTANFEFKEQYINNISIFGAYFDGKHIFICEYPLEAYYKKSDKKLNIDISFDKKSYEPGSEVSANITVTDEKNKPKQTSILLSVVDESVKEIFSPNFLEQFYNSISSSFWYYDGYNIYSSYNPHTLNFYSKRNPTTEGGAEKGSDGVADQYVRSDFRDNPAFIQVDTDKDGKATAKFKLSDAVTSWRVTSLAISEDNYIGDSKSNIISTMPFYVNMVLSNTYLLGDNVSIVVKPHGSEYKFKTSNIQYELVVLKDNKPLFTDNISSLDMHTFDCGKLEIGDYTAQLTLKSGEFTDTISKPFSVIKDGLLLPVTKTEHLSDSQTVLSTINPSKGTIELSFSNGNIRDLMDILYSCISYQSNRTDYQAASAFRTNYPERTDYPYYEVLKQRLSNNYGIPEIIYGDEDLLYTSRFINAFPEFVNKTNTLVNNIKSNLDSEKELDKAAAYLALAALKENVLLEINDQIEIIKNNPDQSVFTTNYEENLRVMFYAAALATLGDYTTAYNLYEQYKYNDSSFAKLDAPNQEYIKTIELLLNSILKPEKAFETLKAKKNNVYVSNVCEKILFLKNAMPIGGISNEFTYNLFDQSKTQTLNNFEKLYLTIDNDQFDKLDIVNKKGETNVEINYKGTNRDLEQNKNLITITESTNLNTEANSNFQKYSRSFEVKLQSNAPSGYYTIYSRIPSNMRYLAANNYGIKNYWINDDNQPIIEISFYYREGESLPVFYYNMIKISDTDAVQSQSYIISDSKDKYWGVTN